jgi:dTDP-4-amino-4,6-dideoxygalactose transaminase
MLSRRIFLAAASALAALPSRSARAATAKPALLGGEPVRKASFPGWPLVETNDEQGLLAALRSGGWNRRTGGRVLAFEEQWARKLGAKHVLATNGGTTALYAALAALEVGPGDEVIVPPYTFIATVNAVLLHHALPVFVDTDPKTHQIDPAKIETAITPRTRAILPVHIAGASCDLDSILAVSKKRSLPVVEDACQAHLAEWRGKSVGTHGDMGCFSFQASKNLNCGEGGCLITNDDRHIASASAFQNNGSPFHGSAEDSRVAHGCNLRMTEFQASILLSQMERIEAQARRRTENAAYLDKLLADVPGITPATIYDGCTRNAYHLYMLRYDREAFAGMPKKTLQKAMDAEGVPLSGGYGPLNKSDFLEKTFASRAFKAIYSEKQIAEWRERNHTPANDKLCDEAFWFSQTTLLASKSDMEQIADAFRKVQRHAADIARA